MQKGISFLLGLMTLSFSFGQQVLYSEKFNGLTLSPTTYGGGTYYMATVPTNMKDINVGNLVTNASGTVFGQSPYNTKGWCVYRQGGITSDTFAVATSDVMPAGQVDKWLITPMIAGIDATTVLSWEAQAYNATEPDGYEVWVTTSTATNLQPSDFTAIGANRIFALQGEDAGVFKKRGASLAAFAGQSVRIAFRNNTYDRYRLYIDDIKVQKGAINLDASIDKILIDKYIVVGNPSVKLAISNKGATSISSLELKYQIDNGTISTITANLPQALAYNAATEYTITSPINFPTKGMKTFKVWISKVNGSTDENASNNTQQVSVSVMTSKPLKKVILREFTGAWNGYSPEGDYKMKQLIAANGGKVIGLAIHNGDGMSSLDGDVIDQVFANSYPSATIDDVLFSGETKVGIVRTKWADKIAERLNVAVPVKVSLQNKVYNSSTRKLEVDVKADFVGEATGDFRINLYLVEDSVSKSTNDANWTQINYYCANCGAQDPTSFYYNYPHDILNYQHLKVVNKILGGSWGSASVIPATVHEGNSFTKHYSFTLPNETANPNRWKAKNMRLVAIVQEYSSTTTARNILNAEEMRLLAANSSTTTAIEMPEHLQNISLYPNPATEKVNLHLETSKNVTVKTLFYTLSGQLILAQNPVFLSEGEHNIPLNINELSAGLYLVAIEIDGQRIYHRLAVE